MAKTILDIVIDLEASASSSIAPVERTKNITYGSVFKVGYVGDLFVEVTSKIALALALENENLVYAEELFDAGMNKIFLILRPDVSTEFVSADVDEAVKVSYHILLASDLVIGATELSVFDGIKYHIKNIVDGTTETLALTSNTSVILTQIKGDLGGDVGEAFASTLVANFVSANVLTSLQLNTFGQYTPLLTDIGAIEDARNKHFTFLGSDDSTVVVPTLMYFRAGGITIADPVIAENLRQDIQTDAFNYIANNNPRYLNSQIGVLVQRGQDIINLFVGRGLILSGSYSIPARSEQLANDILIGKLANVEVVNNLASAIWFITGTMQNNFS